jgi:serine acetyltransferase
MHRSSESANEAVAAGQQQQFVCCSMQLTPAARRLAEVLGRNEGNAMRIFMAFAITMAAAIGLGGCFWHHQAAVVTQPAPPLK